MRLPPSGLVVIILVVLLLSGAAAVIGYAQLSRRHSLDGRWAYRLVVDSVYVPSHDPKLIGHVVEGEMSFSLVNSRSEWLITNYRGTYCGDLAALVRRVETDFPHGASDSASAARIGESRVRLAFPTLGGGPFDVHNALNFFGHVTGDSIVGTWLYDLQVRTLGGRMTLKRVGVAASAVRC
jgi:hypothetical protein